MIIRNLTHDIVLAEIGRKADTPTWRLRGMIGRRFDAFDALVFERCNNIHTCFMSIALDVVFIDADDCVCGLRPNMVPWRFAVCLRAGRVIELPAGALEGSGTAIGDKIGMMS